MAYKAFKATITKNGENARTVLVGANNLSAAAKKAEESIEGSKDEEVVSVETTEGVIL